MSRILLHKGRVVDIEDPLKSGRIRASIPGIFEVEDTKTYPWIMYLTPFGGGVDSGTFVVPQLGEYIFILELVDTLEYLWIGSWNSSLDKPLDSTDNNKTVLYKSITGHTLVFDDTLEKEKFQIIDRSGQIIEFSCALKNDTGQRGDGNSISGAQKSLQTLIDKSHIKIKDLAGNEVGLESSQDSSKIWVSHVSGKKLEITEDGITVQVSEGCKIELLENGDINLNTSGNINVVGTKITLNNGTGGIHSSTNHPVDYFTGTPLNGSPTEFSN